jgi:hypothetical protein
VGFVDKELRHTTICGIVQMNKLNILVVIDEYSEINSKKVNARAN